MSSSKKIQLEGKSKQGVVERGKEEVIDHEKMKEIGGEEGLKIREITREEVLQIDMGEGSTVRSEEGEETRRVRKGGEEGSDKGKERGEIGIEIGEGDLGVLKVHLVRGALVQSLAADPGLTLQVLEAQKVQNEHYLQMR